jgi:hypothetical protein
MHCNAQYPNSGDYFQAIENKNLRGPSPKNINITEKIMSLETLPQHVEAYLSLTPTRKKMIQRMLYGECCRRQIARYAGCTMRQVTRFFSESKSIDKTICLMFGIKKTFDPKSGMQKQNEITLDKDFIFALNWLKNFGYLNSPWHKKSKILEHAKTTVEPKKERQKTTKPKSKMSRGETSKMSTLLKDSLRDLNTHTSKASVCIKPMVKIQGLDEGARIFASKYASDYEICEALEACKYQNARKKIDNLSSYFIGTLKNKQRGMKNAI